MLVHFPSALYPFSLVMDLFSRIVDNSAYTEAEKYYSLMVAEAGKYSLIGALGMSVVAMIYGAIDFLQIDPKSKAWKTAGIHALLNVTWFIVYSTLLVYRMNHDHVTVTWTYVSIMGLTTAGLFFSNYLGADLIIKYRIGIGSENAK